MKGIHHRIVHMMVVGAVLLSVWVYPQEETRDYYEKWLKEDVLWVISEEEKDVFGQLTTDEERDAFIEQFWYRRDPDPMTVNNEYKEEHYRRIAYANENFTAGIDGWKSDRGMVYIKFGPPDRVETYPAGGTYERRRQEGGGQTVIFPTIRWEYRYIEGVGQDVELEFVDDEGGGLYELTWDNQRKDALLLTGSMGPTLDELEWGENNGRDWLNVNKQARVARRRDGGNWAGSMAGASSWETYRDKPFERLEMSAAVNRPVVVRYKDLEAAVSARVTYTELPFDVRADYIRVSEQQMMALVTVLVPNGNMTFRREYGINRAGVQIFGRVTDLRGRVVAMFEDDLAREYGDEEYGAARGRSSIYQKRLVLRPGVYKLEVGVRDEASERIGTVERRLEAPAMGEELGLSSLILAERIEPAEVGESSFDLGSLRVVPSAHEGFERSGSVGLYVQIYNFGVDQERMGPRLKVEYGVARLGSEPDRWWDSTRLVNYAGQYCRLARMVTLSRLEAGEYEIRVRVRDEIRDQEVLGRAGFRVIKR